MSLRADLIDEQCHITEVEGFCFLVYHIGSASAVERGMEEQRLTFARWLVEHGKLSESL